MGCWCWSTSADDEDLELLLAAIEWELFSVGGWRSSAVIGGSSGLKKRLRRLGMSSSKYSVALISISFIRRLSSRENMAKVGIRAR